MFGCAEINSSFHRPHAPATYARWAKATPRAFRFAVKCPRTITHDLKLRRVRMDIERFLDESSGLGSRRGPLLVQLPPSLEFDARVASRFFELVRGRYEGTLVCEPRHPTWFAARADALLVDHRVARVATDPAPVDAAGRPGGWPGVVYYRLHGSPRMYWSRYDEAYIAALAGSIEQVRADVDVWCLFDNTASGAALENAWELQQRLQRGRAPAEVSSGTPRRQATAGRDSTRTPARRP